MVDFQFRGKGVVGNETMYHFDALGFHGVLLAEFVLGDIFIVKIANFFHGKLTIIVKVFSVRLHVIDCIYHHYICITKN